MVLAGDLMDEKDFELNCKIKKEKALITFTSGKEYVDLISKKGTHSIYSGFLPDILL